MRSIALSAVALVGAILLGSGTNVAHAASQTETNTVSKNVTINQGDSLSSIAETNGSTIQRLFDANTSIENPDLIYPGKEIRIPSKDEKLATRPFPAAAPVAVEVPETPQAPAVSSAATTRSTSNAPAVAGGSVWDQLAACESGGNWAINTGNGFYGGLQFTLSSWQAVGGTGMPNEASREEQIMRGQMLQAIQGWGAWPACTSKLGLR